MKRKEIYKLFEHKDIDRIGKQYLHDQMSRYMFLVKVLRAINEETSFKKVLIISPSFELEIIDNAFSDLDIYSIGFRDIRIPYEHHVNFNLNSPHHASDLPEDFRHFDLILCCEVIEHLELPFINILEFFEELIKENGIIIVQTPNHESLSLKLHPEHHNLHHIHLYSFEDLKNTANKEGFRVIKKYFKNYYRYSTIKNKIFNIISLFIPSKFQEGITIIIQRLKS